MGTAWPLDCSHVAGAAQHNQPPSVSYLHYTPPVFLIPYPAIMKKLNWGILATGNIARTFSRAVRLTTNGELLAVASRSQE